MTDPIKIQMPEDFDDNSGDVLDSLTYKQWFNMVRGINRSVDGVFQLAEEVKEGLGITPRGSARAFTEQAQLDQETLREETADARQLPGAEGLLSFETLGEVLPFVAAPLGRTFTQGFGIGAGIGATAFQDDVDDSRAPAALFSGVAGGALARLFSKANSPRQAQLADELDTGTALTTVPRLTGPGGARTAGAASDITPNQPLRGEFIPADNLPVRGRAGRAGETIDGRVVPDDLHLPNTRLLPQGRKALTSLDEAHRAAAKAKIKEAFKQVSTGLSRVEKALAKKELMKASARGALERTQARLKADQDALKVIEDHVNQRPSQAAQAAPESDTLPALPAPDAPQTAPQSATAGPQPEAGATATPNTLGRGQTGSVDPALLGGVAAGGIAGGVATDGNPAGIAAGAALGAFALPALLRGGAAKSRFKSKEGMREASTNSGDFNEAVTRNTKERNFSKEAIKDTYTNGKKVLDEFFGSVETRLANLYRPIAVALRNTEFATHQRAGGWIAGGEKFFNSVDNLPLSDRDMRTFKKLINVDRVKAERFLRSKGQDETADQLREVGTILDDVGVYLNDVGMGVNLLKNYFPRQVIDASRFENVKEVKSYFQHLMNKSGVSDLSDFDKENAITDLLNDALSRGGDETVFGRAAKSLKKRQLGLVTDDTIDAYADPRQAFNNYIEEVTRQVERQRFFKGQGVNSAVGPNGENIDNVTDLLKKGLRDNDLDEDSVDEIAQLIRMRFGPGETAPSRWVQNFKNLTYTGLLGNPISAMTQFGDVALSAYRNGIGNTTVSLVRALANRNKPLSNGLDKETLLGLRDAAQDFASNVKSRDLLNWSLKYSGFRGMDRLGKNVFINSAMMKNQQMGREAFLAKWRPVFGREADDLYEQVQTFNGINNQNKDTIGFMLWNELSDVQPISLSTLPERYLRHPDGRMAYMLQSFTLKLFDLMRRDIVEQAANGNYQRAARNATYLSSLFVTMNGSVDGAKQYVLTGEVDDATELVMSNYLRMLGVNPYMVSTISREGAGSAMLKTLGPPTALPDALTDVSKATKLIPIGGRFISENLPE